jgi:20S proteasome alpha/beta subunit
MSYGAQLVVEAADSDSAVKTAVELFNTAVQRASMPVWPITEVEVLAEDDDYEEYPGESE